MKKYEVNSLFQKSVFLLFLLSFLSCSHVPAKQDQIGQDQAGQNDRTALNLLNPLSLAIRLYQGPLNHLRSVRGDGVCPMHPSCSSYAGKTVKKHGFFIGWMMICDRLMRCGHENEAYPRVISNSGRQKNYDPVRANDFWWQK
ncbi:membrane protein insertion efficiency factor YidD [Desulfobacterales bacterium HSG16]|nr:membrane protein insertion efficiency factor YidD [Desulfobacterales bacterium HSG16]